jgi:hypothetical protein
MRFSGLFAIYGTALGFLAACGGDEREPNPSCCLYECVGPRKVGFSQFFGTVEECEFLAASRCRLAFSSTVSDDPVPEQELMRFEFQPGVESGEDETLNEICTARGEAF